MDGLKVFKLDLVQVPEHHLSNLATARAEPVIWSAAATLTAGVWAELRPAAPALAGRAAGTGVLAVTYSVASISSAATQDA